MSHLNFMLDEARKILEAIQVKHLVTKSLREEAIEIGDVTISFTDIKIKTIAGYKEVSGYCVYAWGIGKYDKYDTISFGEYQNFSDAVAEAVKANINFLLDQYIESKARLRQALAWPVTRGNDVSPGHFDGADH